MHCRPTRVQLQAPSIPNRTLDGRFAPMRVASAESRG